jgi:hypothetical protein
MHRSVSDEGRSAASRRASRALLGEHVIVDDEVDIECRRYIGVDMFEKVEELLVAMLCATLGEDSRIGDVQGYEQSRRAVPNVNWAPDAIASGLH